MVRDHSLSVMEADNAGRLAPDGPSKKPRKRSNTSGPTKTKSAYQKSAEAQYTYAGGGSWGWILVAEFDSFRFPFQLFRVSVSIGPFMSFLDLFGAAAI